MRRSGTRLGGGRVGGRVRFERDISYDRMILSPFGLVCEPKKNAKRGGNGEYRKVQKKKAYPGEKQTTYAK